MAIPTIGWHYVDVSERLRPGNHWHICRHCGRSVQHGHDPAVHNGLLDHTCVCGMVHFEISPHPLVSDIRPSERNKKKTQKNLTWLV